MSIVKSTPTAQSPNLTLNNVRNRLATRIQRAFNTPSETTIIEALPASGKSYGVIEWAGKTGAPLTVFAPRHDLLDEYEEWCEDFDLSYKRLPSFFRDCTSFDGDDEPINDPAERLQDDYNSGQSGVELHSKHTGLPCDEEEGCPFIAKRSENSERYDVLLGTYQHAHRDEWIADRYVAFDEFPGEAYLTEFDDGVESVVSAYLQGEDSLPFTDHFDLRERRDYEEHQEQIEEWRHDQQSNDYRAESVHQNPDTSAHIHGPIATLAVIEMEGLENRWQHSGLPVGRKAVRNPSSGEWTFLLPPDLGKAESVIGLDGTPNQALWELALGEEIEMSHLLNESEKQVYLREVLQLEFIRTTDRWKAIQSGSGAAPPKELALLEGIAEKEETTPALISSQRAIHKYTENGLDEITESTAHYGGLKGMNDFAKERVGIVIGNPHPGDHVIEKWSALAGVPAQRKTRDGEELTGNSTDYGYFGNHVMETLIHDEVLQAAMRFGREEAADGTRGATIYLHTTAVPEWLSVEKQIPEIHSWQTEKDGMRDVISAIRSLDAWRSREWKATELYDHTSIVDKQVRNCLEKLDGQNYIVNRGSKGQGGALHYADHRLAEAGEFGHVDFGG